MESEPGVLWLFTLFMPIGLITLLVVSIVWRNLKNKKFTIISSISLIAAWLVLYIFLSSLGEYRYSMSGRNRLAGGIALKDQVEWFPKWISFHHHEFLNGNLIIWCYGLDIVFAGLVEIDRKYWHRTKDIFGKDVD